MGGVPAEIIGDRTVEQPCDAWSPSDHPEFREFLDHVAEILAHEYVQRMRETAYPKDIEAWEKGRPLLRYSLGGGSRSNPLDVAVGKKWRAIPDEDGHWWEETFSTS